MTFDLVEFVEKGIADLKTVMTEEGRNSSTNYSLSPEHQQAFRDIAEAWMKNPDYLALDEVAQKSFARTQIGRGMVYAAEPPAPDAPDTKDISISILWPDPTAKNYAIESLKKDTAKRAKETAVRARAEENKIIVDNADDAVRFADAEVNRVQKEFLKNQSGKDDNDTIDNPTVLQKSLRDLTDTLKAHFEQGGDALTVGDIRTVAGDYYQQILEGHEVSHDYLWNKLHPPRVAEPVHEAAAEGPKQEEVLHGPRLEEVAPEGPKQEEVLHGPRLEEVAPEGPKQEEVLHGPRLEEVAPEGPRLEEIQADATDQQKADSKQQANGWQQRIAKGVEKVATRLGDKYPESVKRTAALGVGGALIGGILLGSRKGETNEQGQQQTSAGKTVFGAVSSIVGVALTLSLATARYQLRNAGQQQAGAER